MTYGYDAFGRLVRRTKSPADGEVPPVAERSVYIWHEREILAEYEAGERGELELYKEYFRAAGRLVAVKMHGFHGRREPGPEGFLHSKGGLMYYHSGRLGSPVAITDRHGEPIARYAWDAYGRAMAGVFEPYNSVGFTGKMRDGATGLTYFGARWYDNESGKFLSRDPIKDGWNWHAYVGGDPVNFVDPWGLMKTESNGRDTSKTLSVAGSVATATGVGLTSGSLASDKLKNMRTTRTFRDRAGELMRKTGQLARKGRVRQLAKTAGPTLAKAGVLTSVAAIASDLYALSENEMGVMEFSVKTTGNVLSAIPTPVTATSGLAVTFTAEYVW